MPVQRAGAKEDGSPPAGTAREPHVAASPCGARLITRFQGTPDDVAEAVAARVARSRFLYEGSHRYVVLLEESVLRYRTAEPEAMRGQLRHLLAVMPLASVSLGIIPFTA